MDNSARYQNQMQKGQQRQGWSERFAATLPAINIYEDSDEYEVQIAAPGLTKEDVSIRIENGDNLVATVEKRHENDTEGMSRKYLRREFAYSKFVRSISLPDDVNRDKISARVENGILLILLPKMSEEERFHQRKINVD